MVTTTRTRRLLIGSGLALASLLGAACGSDSATDAGSGGSAGTGAETASGTLEISDVWARTSPASVDTGAAYMTITGGTDDDTLLSASVEASVAGMVQIHEMVPAGEGTGDTMAMGGSDTSMAMGSDTSAAEDEAMVMQELKDGLAIPAGDTVKLAPGGYHVMLLELAEPLKEGATFDLTLTFEQAGEKTVPVEVRTDAP